MVFPVTTDRISRDDSVAFPEFDDDGATPPHPMTLARRWLDAATSREVREPLSMTLATASTDGVVSARTVDVKEFADEGLLFGTGTDSPTGVQLTANPSAALHAYWRETAQQLRFEGHVIRLDDAAADALFAGRSPKSRAATAASHQSAAFPAGAEPLAVIDDLVARADGLLDDHGDDVPRPAGWTAYRLVPDVVEFWLGARDRMYRRLRYRDAEGTWRVDRLQP
jgi:pyridoxamine-phosphate oxidase